MKPERDFKLQGGRIPASLVFRCAGDFGCNKNFDRWLCRFSSIVLEIARANTVPTQYPRFLGQGILQHPMPSTAILTKAVLPLTKAAVSCFLADNGMRMAASLAYFTIFSLAPLLVITIVIAGVGIRRYGGFECNHRGDSGICRTRRC
jgi:hypothetical protein